MRDPSTIVKHWRMMPPIPPDVQERLHDYHAVLAQVLYNRGQDTREKVQVFLEGGAAVLHNPFSMHGMPQAVARIRYAIKHQELIAIYGDFDADGITSTALLTQAFEALGARVLPYIPSRVDEGYGLNMEALQGLYADGVRLVITVDCGIRAVEEVAFANTLGLDMIVTDHHSLGEELPPALAVLDPKLDAQLRLEEGNTNGYPEDMLAGVGVAYKLAEALFRAEEQQTRCKHAFQLDGLLDLVALGTVADLAPLDRPENRELVRRGLKVMNRAQRPGIYELAQVARVEPGKINTTSIGYMLGPRINAAGRLDNAMIAYYLLTSNMPQAGRLAHELQELNVQRQTLTTEAVELARKLVFSEVEDDLPLIFVMHEDFLSGIVGLVAGRLCEEFYVPAIVIEKGAEESRGSCRSIAEFNVTQALDQCADLLVRHGGHAQAAGFTVSNENMPLLRERLMTIAANALCGQDLRPALDIDVEIAFGDLTMNLAKTLQQLEPTGVKNSAPVFVTRHLLVADCRRVGQEGRHLKMRFANHTQHSRQLDAIGFRLGDWADHLPPYVDVAYRLEVNEWNRQAKVQLNVQDLRPAE